jgi:serine/threonine-protein kinase
MSHKNRKRSSFPPSIGLSNNNSGLSNNSSRRSIESGRHLIETAPSQHEGTASMPVPGMMVAGRFRMERRIASGAMGDVWQGVHCDLRLRVAIKTLRRDMISSHEVVARFSREAFLLGRIQSDHVVRVLDFVADRRLGPVLVTELIDGASLASILATRRFSVEEAVDLAIDLVSGLRELHRAHIIHRDVKPANILMRKVAEEGYRAVFIDLGVSRLVTESEPSDDCLTEITSAERAVGTYEYMAPEQIVSSRTVTPSADVYAVGAILYRAVAGHHAYGDQHGLDLVKRKLKDAAPELDTARIDAFATGFEEIVARALAISPSDRYETADAMLADLAALRATARQSMRVPKAVHEAGTVDEPAPVSVSTTSRSATKEKRRRVRSITAIVALAGIVVGVAGGLAIARGHAVRTARLESLVFGSGRCTVEPRGADAEGRATYRVACDP